MDRISLIDTAADAIPVVVVSPNTVDQFFASHPEAAAWLGASGFQGKPGTAALYPAATGGPAGAVVGIGADFPLQHWAAVAASLPAGTYTLDPKIEPATAEQAALGWALAGYRFDRYKSFPDDMAKLVWPAGIDRAAVARLVEANFLARDLVNTPAQDMGPEQLAARAEDVAKAFGAQFSVIIGNKLLDQGYPAVHAVGRAAAQAPRLIEITWGAPDAPRVTLVGKGVCFDTGGLDIKSAGGMKLMKKDMGGAAHVLALGQMIMAAALPVRLRILIPAVENAVAGNALHPLDVVPTRSGKTIEIGHTDAEGRVILSDALVEAVREDPALVIDMATLTGAARVALGTDLPALFSNDDAWADSVLAQGLSQGDPLWRLPLWAPYRPFLDSGVADISNEPASPFGGAITAALFLKDFVGEKTPWMHIDLMAWNPRGRPGHPEGAAAQGLRALFGAIAERFPA
ncbi:MAG: leucyl aminopeptidase family protein [Magnetospiraceae bacterium]